jgi:hypothetical protein
VNVAVHTQYSVRITLHVSARNDKPSSGLIARIKMGYYYNCILGLRPQLSQVKIYTYNVQDILSCKMLRCQTWNTIVKYTFFGISVISPEDS